MANDGKKNGGCQRVTMAFMEEDNNRQVAFSKRRCSLFQKVNELCSLYGSHVAIVVYSPGKKAFSFSHPNVEAVLSRFFGSSFSNPTGVEPALKEALRNSYVKELTMELSLMNTRIKIEKNKTKELTKAKQVMAKHTWINTPMEELTLEQLHEYACNLAELRTRVIQYGNENLAGLSTASPHMAINPILAAYHGGIINPNHGLELGCDDHGHQ